MKAILAIDDAPGERRRVLLDESGAPYRLELRRRSESARPRAGELWSGRVRGKGPGGRGWFVDLGHDPEGLLDGAKAPSLTEGQAVTIVVRAEGRGTKGPLLSLSGAAPLQERIGRLETQSGPDPFLVKAEIVETLEGAAAADISESALDEALSTLTPIPGGGRLSVEPTRALTVIDVDSAGRPSGPGAEEALNAGAAIEAARQIALRAVSGLVVIDFVGGRHPKGGVHLAEGLRRELRQRLGRRCEVLALSAFGLCEVAIPHVCAPIAEDRARAAKGELEALAAMRSLLRVGRNDRSGRLVVRLSPAAKTWIDRFPEMADDLTSRIGARWRMELADAHVANPQAWSER